MWSSRWSEVDGLASSFVCWLVRWMSGWFFGLLVGRLLGEVVKWLSTAFWSVVINISPYFKLSAKLSTSILFLSFFFRVNIRDLRYLSILNLKNIRCLSLNTMWLMDMVDHELWWDRLIKFPQASSRWKQHQSLWSIFVGKVKHRRPKLKLEKSCSQPDWTLPMDSAELWCSL